MIDLRPDVVYVVDAAVWRDFQHMRDRWNTANCVGFHDECVWHTRQAIKDGKPELAAHWQKVKRLAEEYGVSWVSAVEVDGELIREEPKFPVLRYPEDHELKRITIGGGPYMALSDDERKSYLLRDLMFVRRRRVTIHTGNSKGAAVEYQDEDFDLDTAMGFAQRPEEKALNTAWSAMSEAMLQAMIAIHAGTDEDGKLSVIADSLEQGMEALKKTENILGLSFIPARLKDADGASDEQKERNIPF